MTPFDFVKLFHSKKTKWDELNENEKKAWNTFITNRALSFSPDYLDIVSKIAPYTGGQLTPAEIFKYYQSVLPSNYRFQKWIKGKKSTTFNKDLVETVSAYFECSHKQAEDYLSLLGKKELKQFLFYLGIQDNEIKKLTKK